VKKTFNKKWVIVFILVVIGLSMPLNSAGSAANPNFPKGVSTDLEDPPFIFQQQTPESEMRFLPEDERDRFIDVAQVFTHPDTRRVLPDQTVSARSLIEYPENYDRYHVEISGKVISIHAVEKLLPTDWPMAYVIVIDDGTAWLSLLYRGDVSRLSGGGMVHVIGVFVNEGNAIHADVVYPEKAQADWFDRLALYLPFSWPDDLPVALPIATLILIFSGLLAILIGISRRIFSILLIPILVSISLTSCELQIDNIIFADGRISTSTRLSESNENVEFFYEIPGVRRYIGSWITQLRDQGMAVENWASDDREFFHLQQRHPDLASFSKVAEDEADTWVFVTSYQTGDYQCFRYLANIDPQEMYSTPPNTEQTAVNELHKYLDKMDFKYFVTLPGGITYGNHSQATGNRMTWQVNTKRPNQIVAEILSLSPGRGGN
jgi:hypothetical protein